MQGQGRLEAFVGIECLKRLTGALAFRLTLGLLARQPAHITELPDPGLTERLSLHGRGGLAHGSPDSRK